MIETSTRDILISLTITFLILIILISMILFILNQFSPFRECEGKPDYYNASNGMNCGELRVINNSIALT